MEQIRTRKTESRYTSTDPDSEIGMFIASAITKTWHEDFIDDSTGEVVTIERNEIIMQQGTEITPDIAASIKFYLQAGEIEDFEVSDQQRLAKPYKGYGLHPFKVCAEIGRKKHSFILQAKDTRTAMEVAEDFIELNFSDHYGIVSVKALDNVVILNDRLKTMEEAEEDKAEAQDGSENTKEKSVRYYKIEAQVGVKSDNQEDAEPTDATFIVQTKDVDTAKAVIEAWLSVKFAKEKDEQRELENLTILAAQPFNCNAIIDRAFCLAYADETEPKTK